jgi:monovalent cation:H+ antiporter-2, CPA2 family
MADVLLIKTPVVILASVSISLVARAGLSAAGGYLLAGLVIGPHDLHLIATSDETRFLAELSIIFLMFMVGLEFSFSAMITACRDVFIAGSPQVGLTVLIVAGIAMLWGVGLPALCCSAARSPCHRGPCGSSISRCARQVEAGRRTRAVGGAAPARNGSKLHSASRLSFASRFLALGSPGLPERTRQISFGSPFLLLALGTAFAGRLAGICAPIGAFLADMVVGESDFHHQVVAKTRSRCDI